MAEADGETLGAVGESFDKSSLKINIFIFNKEQIYSFKLTLLFCLYNLKTNASWQLSKIECALRTTNPVILSMGTRFFNMSTTNILVVMKCIPPDK